ncbi:RNA polymerase sigma factor [Kribbella pratensis]|uniref:RNA polymerase sigma factor n=1 Tax=Kribbella pratensis TaxID=2512112 RepID=A0A4R8CP84_9ACTN|nr:RNA polymerase sigma factor [Kribbella pratensis]TDW77941.1 putative RNA polymerase sigma factor [Kribbella pratensis]
MRKAATIDRHSAATDTAALDTTVATLWRVESPRVIARLVRLVGDVDTAEELTQDAFVTAIEKWRSEGIPNNPAAWLHKCARFLAVDRIRRRDTLHSKYRQIAATSPQTVAVDIDEVVDGDLADDLLGLIFMVCHPILSPDARSALTLKVICGLKTEDVARAFLAPEPTIAQRIVRAKLTLAAASIRFELPEATERSARLAAVREVIYLVFNEGHTATSGEQWIRIDLCTEALRLGRMLASLTPRDPETLGLLALMELQASRLKARTGPQGEPILLMDQDRTRWDQLLVRRGLALLRRVDELGGSAGPYSLQAAIAACHARARTVADTDWHRITALYDGLAQISPSPVIELNRAVATAQAFGPHAGLALLSPLFDLRSMRRYHLLPAVTGDLLCRAGRHEEARQQFLRAAALTKNSQERSTMQGRAAECASRHADIH